MDNTIVAVMSDHGEEFLEHGYLLHEALYRESVHVPLILFHPRLLDGERVVEGQVELIGLAPTLLELAGLPVPEQMWAPSLVPYLDGVDPERDSPTYSEAPWWHGEYHRAFRASGFTLYEREGGPPELFDTRSDPGETRNLAEEDPEGVEALRREMEAFLATRRRPPAEIPYDLRE
jgi:iduronate 2-sulfatase